MPLMNSLLLLCLPNVLFDIGVTRLVFAEKGQEKARLTSSLVPEIRTGPTNATVFVDGNHTFYCQTSGQPRPWVVWQKKNDSGLGLDGDWKDINRSNGRIRNSSGRLVFGRLLALDSGYYKCMAVNKNGNTSSGMAYLNVQAKAAIVEGPRNQTVTWGSEVLLPCEAVGKPLPVRSWYRNGEVVRNESTHLPMSGPLLTFNATETATYECRVQNTHSEGVTNVSAVAMVRVIEGKCEPYEGNVCRESSSAATGHHVISRISEPNYQARMEKAIENLLAEGRMGDPGASEECLDRALRVLCRMAFPPCREGSKSRQPLCRESCLAVSNLFCVDWWTRRDVRSLFDCTLLPQRGQQQQQQQQQEKCEFVNFFDIGNNTETTSCYQGKGEWYVGDKNMTTSGSRCQPWKNLHPHRHLLNPIGIGTLRNNHCRNPGGVRERPWCFTMNQSAEWEFCDVPICGNNTDATVPPIYGSTFAYLAAAVLALGLVLLALPTALVLLRRRSRRGRGRGGRRDRGPLGDVDTRHSPDDEKLVSELRQLPSVEVVARSTPARPSPFSRYEFDRNLVVHVEDIAVGAFGPVFEARLDSGRRPLERNGPIEAPGGSEPLEPPGGSCRVAVKVLDEGSGDPVRREFVRQASLLASFDHPNIVRLVGVCFVGSPLCVAVEFMARGDLRSFLPTLEPSHFIHSPGRYVRSRLLVARQLASVLRHLERLGFLHRDLAARNFLVSAEDQPDGSPLVKLADFGLAVKLEPGEVAHVGVESEAIAVRWTAPESVARGRFSFASDVWSFGVLLWEVFSYGRKPYGHLPSLEDVSRFVLGGGRLESPCPDHPEIFDLMKNCWHFRPEARCTATELSGSIDAMIDRL